MKHLILMILALNLVSFSAEAKWEKGPRYNSGSCAYNEPYTKNPSIRTQGLNVTSACLVQLTDSQAQGLVLDIAYEASELWTVQAIRKTGTSSDGQKVSYELWTRYAGIWTPTGYVSASAAEAKQVTRVSVTTDATGHVLTMVAALPDQSRFTATNFKAFQRK